MGKKLDKLMADMQAELDGEKPETKTEEVEQEETPAPEPEKDDPEPDPEPAQETEQDEPPTEQTEDKPDEGKPVREIPDDPVKRAEFAFKRQLGKNKEKYEKELAERDSKYDKLAKEFEEFKKQMTPKEPMKVREDFDNDEDFINYLLEKGMEKGFAKRDEEQAKLAAEAAEKEKARKAEEEEIQNRQKAWLDNVDNAFDHDEARSKKFLERVQFANSNGLGEILDNCPVAADYLMNDPMGPVVFEHILNDRESFDRVFDTRRLTPLNIFYQLKRVEEGLTARRIRLSLFRRARCRRRHPDSSDPPSFHWHNPQLLILCR